MACLWLFSVRSFYYFFGWQKLRKLIIYLLYTWNGDFVVVTMTMYVCKGVWITWSEVITTIRSNVNWFRAAWCYPSNPTVHLRGGGGPSSHQDSHTFKCQRLDHWFSVNLWGVWNEYWQLVWFGFGEMNEDEWTPLSFLVEPVYFFHSLSPK